MPPYVADAPGPLGLKALRDTGPRSVVEAAAARDDDARVAEEVPVIVRHRGVVADARRRRAVGAPRRRGDAFRPRRSRGRWLMAARRSMARRIDGVFWRRPAQTGVQWRRPGAAGASAGPVWILSAKPDTHQPACAGAGQTGCR